MNIRLLTIRSLFAAGVFALSATLFTAAQIRPNPKTKKEKADTEKNFPVSPNPKKRPIGIFPAQPKPEDTTAKVENQGADEQKDTETVNAETASPEVSPTPASGNGTNTDAGVEGTSSAEKLAAVARSRSSRERFVGKPLTDIYRVGAGDVLDIKILNAESKDSTLFTVEENGAVDYPLAGGVVPVEGLTAEEIDEVLTAKIKLYENPNVTVTVRSCGSHKITVIGQVERAGAKTLCREAVPLYTVLAEAVPQSSANRAVIMRSGKETIEVDLEDAAATDTLVMTGDVIRISAAAVSTALKTDQFYYINGVINGGEKSYRQGITLTQAIMASGGLSRPSAVKVTVFRQNAEGLLVSTEYSLKEIKMGKTPDPQIQAGDRIEVKN